MNTRIIYYRVREITWWDKKTFHAIPWHADMILLLCWWWMMMIVFFVTTGNNCCHIKATHTLNTFHHHQETLTWWQEEHSYLSNCLWYTSNSSHHNRQLTSQPTVVCTEQYFVIRAWPSLSVIQDTICPSQRSWPPLNHSNMYTPRHVII